jgi:hypothetical protein
MLIPQQLHRYMPPSSIRRASRSLVGEADFVLRSPSDGDIMIAANGLYSKARLAQDGRL